MNTPTNLKCSAGQRFHVSVADGIVAMELVSIRCGDVWNCSPVNPNDEYGSDMVFTDDDLAWRLS